MSLPPHTRLTVPLVTSSKPERLLRSSQHTHDRHDSSPTSVPSSASSATHLNMSGRTLSASHNPTDPPSSIFTPSSPPFATSRLRKASSSSQLDRSSGYRAFEHNLSNEDDDVLYGIAAQSSGHKDQALGLRPRIGNTWTSKPRHEKPISTGRVRGAGETETELDEPSRHLPISRRVATPPPLTPLTPLARITPLLFETFRLLSVVPAFAGICYHLFNLYQPQSSHSRLDHVVCFLWALLTAHQCLRLTTGLLTRWTTYYPPLPTLIRLLALQAICWPATQYTLVLFNHERRPVICWAIIGSTTCISRSIQIWVTSNLCKQNSLRLEGKGSDSTGVTWGPRRWDWSEVGVKCALPMGVVYFVMAWAEAFRRELNGC